MVIVYNVGIKFNLFGVGDLAIQVTLIHDFSSCFYFFPYLCFNYFGKLWLNLLAISTCTYDEMMSLADTIKLASYNVPPFGSLRRV